MRALNEIHQALRSQDVPSKFNKTIKLTLKLSVSNASDYSHTSTKISRHPSITEGAHTCVRINSNLITGTVTLYGPLHYTQGSYGAKTVIEITQTTN